MEVHRPLQGYLSGQVIRLLPRVSHKRRNTRLRSVSILIAKYVIETCADSPTPKPINIRYCLCTCERRLDLLPPPSRHTSHITPVIAILCAIIAICFALLLLRRPVRVGGHLPPGPPPLPLFGNLFDFTLKELWLRVTSQWAQKYGACRLRSL